MSSIHEYVRLVESLEDYLGDPADVNNLVNFQRCLQFDEEEAIDWDQIRFVQDFGYFDYFIPESLGGSFNSLLQLYGTGRAIAQRDLTLAIALGLSFFGALPIWIGGSVEQKQQLSAWLKLGKIGALALTELDHGSDLIGNEMHAIRLEEGWELSGGKWCINFATEGDTVLGLTRTKAQGGVFGFSLFLMDKSVIENGFSTIPKLHTHGVRGLDISGFKLDRLQLPENALIGQENHGLEIIYKMLQVTRSLCASLSVGSVDTALRLALSFSLDRQLYGKTAFNIPVVKQRLGEIFTELLIADCTSMMICRAATLAPEYLSLWSAILKFLIPHSCEHLVEQCGLILGARGFLRTAEFPMYQKMRRDTQVVGLFDGSSQVNLSVIAGSLLPQARQRGQSDRLDDCALLFNLEEPCPAIDLDKLRLFVRQEDPLLAGLSLIQSDEIDPLVHAVRQEIACLDQYVMNHQSLDPRSLTAFRLAEAYCWLVAASCCLQAWFYNPENLQPELKDPAWLRLAVQLILNKLKGLMPKTADTTSTCRGLSAASIMDTADKPRYVAPDLYGIDSTLQETMAEHLCQFHLRNHYFSIIPLQLAGDAT